MPRFFKSNNPNWYLAILEVPSGSKAGHGIEVRYSSDDSGPAIECVLTSLHTDFIASMTPCPAHEFFRALREAEAFDHNKLDAKWAMLTTLAAAIKED